MAKRGSKKQRSLGGTIIAIITTLVIGAAVLLTNLTGIDLVGMLGIGTPQPGTSVVTNPPASGNVSTIPVRSGHGASSRFWQVYFTAPTGSSDRNTYTGSIDMPLAEAIGAVQRTLDIAAFEWNNPIIHQAVLDARRRGVQIRMVADNEHTVEDDDSTIDELEDAGIRIAYDERSAFMHNKFMIMDSQTLWTGSTNYTVNDVYRNNNNMLMLRSRRAVDAYQAEFNEMFNNRQFGGRRAPINGANFQQDGVSVQILFAPEDQVIATMTNELRAARSNIRFMAFSFTLEDIASVLLQRAQDGVTVEGIFETRGSETEFSELRPLYCAGLPVFQDGNNFTMHHKVFIVDNTTVLTGSFNFSANATNDNDENLVIIKDPDLVAQYIAEFNRLRSQAVRPTGLCR